MAKSLQWWTFLTCPMGRMRKGRAVAACRSPPPNREVGIHWFQAASGTAQSRWWVRCCRPPKRPPRSRHRGARERGSWPDSPYGSWGSPGRCSAAWMAKGRLRGCDVSGANLWWAEPTWPRWERAQCCRGWWWSPQPEYTASPAGPGLRPASAPLQDQQQ